MTEDTKTVVDPTGRAVAVFANEADAKTAVEALHKIGFDSSEIQYIHGTAEAEDVDASAKWFADTDELLERYRQKLASGASLVSVPAAEDNRLKEVQEVYRLSGADTMTNFGTWVTRTVSLRHAEKEKPIDDK